MVDSYFLFLGYRVFHIILIPYELYNNSPYCSVNAL